MTSRHVLAAAAIVLLGPKTSSGDENVTFRLTYSAPEGCTDAAGFARAMLARSRRVRVGSGADSTEIVVDVERREVGYAGRIRAEPRRSESIDRRVRGDRCEEVVDALSFIAALALDPEATSDPQPRAETPSPPPTEPSPKAAEAGLRWSFGGGLHLLLLTNAVPRAGLGYGAFFEATSEGALLAPSLLAFVERTAGDDVNRQSGSADFSLLGGGAELCPLRFPEAGTPVIRPCAGVWAGSVHAEAHNVTVATQPTRTWLAAFASLRGSWVFSAPILVFAEAGAGVPLLPQHYRFDSGETVFDTPTVAAFLRAGAGVSFR